jgi:hypothetical protein
MWIIEPNHRLHTDAVGEAPVGCVNQSLLSSSVMLNPTRMNAMKKAGNKPDRDVIRVNLAVVKQIIDRHRSHQKTIYTSDVIRDYCGGFYANRRIPPSLSFNAQFGKILKANSGFLRIKELNANVSIRDDIHHPTSASKWKI